MLGSRAAESGVERHDSAPGRDRRLWAVKLVHGLIWRTSHQKCLMFGSRRGKEMLLTRDGAGLEEVR